MSEPKLPTFPPATLKMLKPIEKERDGYFDVEYRFEFSLPAHMLDDRNVNYASAKIDEAMFCKKLPPEWVP